MGRRNCAGLRVRRRGAAARLGVGRRLPDRLRTNRMAAHLGDLPTPRPRPGDVHCGLDEFLREPCDDLHPREDSRGVDATGGILHVCRANAPLFVFVRLACPETKGKTLEEIEAIMSNKKPVSPRT